MRVVDGSAGVVYLINKGLSGIRNVENHQPVMPPCDIRISPSKINTIRFMQMDSVYVLWVTEFCGVKDLDSFFIADKGVPKLNCHTLGMLDNIVANERY